MKQNKNETSMKPLPHLIAGIPIRGAVFDLDGTVLDSMPIWTGAGSRYLRSKGIQPKPTLFAETKTMNMIQAASFFQQEYHLHESVPVIINEVNGMLMEFYRHEARPKPGVRSFLQQMALAGIPMCIATATKEELVQAALRHTGLDRYFSKVFGCTEWNTSKNTSPYIFKVAQKFLGTPQHDTVVFEDAAHAVAMAKKGGFPVIAVADDSMQKERPAIRQTADLFVDSFTALQLQ